MQQTVEQRLFMEDMMNNEGYPTYGHDNIAGFHGFISSFGNVLDVWAGFSGARPNETDQK